MTVATKTQKRRAISKNVTGDIVNDTAVFYGLNLSEAELIRLEAVLEHEFSEASKGAVGVFEFVRERDGAVTLRFNNASPSVEMVDKILRRHDEFKGSQVEYAISRTVTL